MTYDVPPTYNATDSLAWAWRKFTAEPTPFALLGLICLGVVVAVYVVIFMIAAVAAAAGLTAGGLGRDGNLALSAVSFGAKLFDAGLSLAGGLVASVVTFTLVALLLRLALDVASGIPADLGSVFARVNYGKIAVFGLGVGLITGVLSAISAFIPMIQLVELAVGIVVSLLTWFAVVYLVDEDLPIPDAVAKGLQLTTDNIGQVLLLAVLGTIHMVAGVLFCLIGSVVAAPVVALMTVHAYRNLRGQAIAP